MYFCISVSVIYDNRMLKSVIFPLNVYFASETQGAVASELDARRLGSKGIKEIASQAKKIYSYLDGKLADQR